MPPSQSLDCGRTARLYPLGVVSLRYIDSRAVRLFARVMLALWLLLGAEALADDPSLPPSDLAPDWAQRLADCFNAERTNEYRRLSQQGASGPLPGDLSIHADLSKGAQKHSAYLAAKGILSPTRADGEPVWKGILNEFGEKFESPYGHAIFRTPFTIACRVSEIVLDNAEVKKTMLGAQYKWMGIGVARGVHGDHYWTFLLAHELKAGSVVEIVSPTRAPASTE